MFDPKIVYRLSLDFLKMKKYFMIIRNIQKMSVEIIKGNLLDMPADVFIVHQCNCTTTTAKGLSAQVFKKYPYANIYKATKRNGVKTKGIVRVPGDIIIKTPVINLLGQNRVGKPGTDETAAQREEWFQQGLNKISEYVIEKIAFPHGIGCGLSKGNWENYLEMIEKFAQKNPEMHVMIVQLP